MSHSSNEIGWVISLALFLHKAPEAAGYGSFLAFSQISMYNRLLFIFVSNFLLLMHTQIYACSSPLTAIGGFLVFNSFQDPMADELSVQRINWWNGLVMLVSVGTLLYITTMHMLPEVYSGSHHDHHGTTD